MTKRRIIVLGGGCAGVAAAWELSRTEQLRAAFEVTVVQPGCRLGGKGATSRDPRRGDAILEHGLHMWLGSYNEAFAMMHDVYGAWNRPATGAQRSLSEAFSPMSRVALLGGTETAPEVWDLDFPASNDRPWDPARPAALSWMALASTWARRMPDALGGGSLTTRAARSVLLMGLGAAIARGLTHELATRGRTAWDHMDTMDLRAWLARHGATPAQADAPPIRALYDLGFAYPDGIPGPGRGAAAAGVALRVLLQLFAGYRGAPFYRMNAGMGDTVFAPLYEVLRARGVTFRFFHRLERLKVQGPRIAEIDLALQARDPEGYSPLKWFGPIRGWPGEPDRGQLSHIADGDLEADAGPSLGRRTLYERDHFDEVVLAIPATAHHRFAQDLISQSPRYRKMVESTHGVATIAAQWWLSRKTSQLGWSGRATVLSGLPGLFRTWADLSELAGAEAWQERPSSIAYFCNVAPPELGREVNRQRANEWLANAMPAWADRTLHHVWPRATRNLRFDEAVLHHLPDRAAWRTPYSRANVADWERYILSLPGTISGRLAPDDSGFDNLVLAGDWTKNKINGGSVEAAVSSGVEAARAIVARS